MSAITLNEKRIAHFTNSAISCLLPGKKGERLRAGDTYIEEKILELKFGCCLETESSSNAMTWGKVCEVRINNLLGTDYISVGNQTKEHPSPAFKGFWSGSADFDNPRGKFIAESKCYQRKQFALFTECILQAKKDKNPSLIKDKFPSEYWQAISNALIYDYDQCELISYMPRFDELPLIAEICQDDMWFQQGMLWQAKTLYDTIEAKEWHKLAFIPQDCKNFESLNIYLFTIPDQDRELLIKTVASAIDILKEAKQKLGLKPINSINKYIVT